MHQRIAKLAFITGIALAAGLACTTVRAEPVKIRAGWVVAPASLAPVLFANKGITKHLGKSYTYDTIYYGASPKQITGLNVGELDVAALGFSSFPFAVQNGGLTDLRIIADEIQDGGKDYFTGHFMVRKDSGINKVEDLKGKVLAVNGIGTGVHMAMTAMLKRHGLQENRDYTVIEARFPTMTAVLKEKRADMIITTTPFIWAPDLQAMAKTLFTDKDALGTSALSFWTARKGFIEKNRAAMVDFLEDAIRATRWYKDPANRKEAIAILSKFLKRPPAAFEQWVFTKKDFYRDDNLLVDLDGLQRNVNTMKDIGVIKTGMNVKDYADLSLVKEAAARLK
jgi:ABC-type nitrate/sulfonate/bicarbonate transport system substrate-binding protein